MVHKSFVAEASLAGKFNHPHMINIYDAVVEPDRSYLVMEYVHGGTLEAHASPRQPAADRQGGREHFKCIRASSSTRSKRGDPPRHQARARSLSSRARPRWGTSGPPSNPQLGNTTQLRGIGSPPYMSPEHRRREKITHQTDIYSLGVTMFRLLTGRMPYEAGSHVALTYAISTRRGASPRTSGRTCPTIAPRRDRDEGDRQGARPSATSQSA